MDTLAPIAALHPIIAVVGPAGAGKTALIDFALPRFAGALGIVRTVTTRPPRDEGEERHTNCVGIPRFCQMLADGDLMQKGRTVYDGNWYDNYRPEVHELLHDRVGICAWVEGTVTLFRELGYTVHMVRVTPSGDWKPRSEARWKADQERERKGPWANKFFVNDFSPGGFAASGNRFVRELEPWLSKAK